MSEKCQVAETPDSDPPGRMSRYGETCGLVNYEREYFRVVTNPNYIPPWVWYRDGNTDEGEET